MLAAADLWQFSLMTYARAGVANHCLYLQDRWGANINIILWLAWLARQNLQIDAQTITRAETRIANWHENLVEPVRQLRRTLSAQLSAQLAGEIEVERELMDATYQQFKSAELHAEQVEQALLAGLQVGIQSSARSSSANLALYLDGLGVSEADQLRLFDLLGCFS